MLWGDDDIIMLGYGDPEYFDRNDNVIMIDVDAYVYAGDGDDLVDIHGQWMDYYIRGGRGNDTFNVDGGW